MDEIKLDVDKVEAAAVRGHALDFPRTGLSDAIDRFITAIAAVLNWIWVVLVLLIVLNVALRYMFGTNIIALEEMQWHLYAIGIMLGLGFTLQQDGHVRVDVLAERLPRRRRAWIELLGLLLIVLPLVGIILYQAWPFVTRAYRINEVSAAPGGLPYRWAIKSVILIAFAYLGLAAFSRLMRVSSFLFGVPAPRPD
jgi:TRAP-type mannitol/chloroaromatic compound transport system permease small subunit